MSSGTTTVSASFTTPTRKVPRYRLTIPLGLTVLRSGVPDSLHGRTLEIGEGGIGVVVASRLLLGESVRVEFLLPHMTTPVRATAVVRYQRAQCFGLQFLRLPEEQKSIIRYWTRREAEVLLVPRPSHDAPVDHRLRTIRDDRASDDRLPLPSLEGAQKPNRWVEMRSIAAVAVPVLVLVAAAGWWRWQQGWKELDAQKAATERIVAVPQFEVPAETMQQRLRHSVPPEYPEDAQHDGLEGTVILHLIVNTEGAVTQVDIISGPAPLALVASDAVRWWRYEPYVVNGRPVTVETMLAVDFRLPNR